MNVPYEHLWSAVALLLLTLLSITTVGLLGIWTALGRGHWFVRVAVVSALLGPLLLIPAYEPLVVFVIQLWVAVPVLVIARRRRQRCLEQSMWHSVRDLLCLTSVVALVAAVGTSAPASVWQSWQFLEAGIWFDVPEVPPWAFACIMGILAGVMTCLSAWIVLGQARWWIRLAAIVLGFPLGLVGMTWWLVFHSFWSHRLNSHWSLMGALVRRGIAFDELLLVCSVLSLLLIVAWIVLFRVAWRGPTTEIVLPSHVPGQNRRQWPCKLARGAWMLLSLVMLVPLVWAYAVLVVPLSVRDSILPEPNAYEELAALGKQLKGVAIPKDDTTLPPSQRPTPQEFIDFEKQHRELLEKAHANMNSPSLVPLSYDTKYLDNLDVVDPTRQLARAMIAAGHAASLQGNNQQAIERYVDTIVLARQNNRGGLIIHWLIGNAIEGMGKSAIHTNRNKIPTAQRQSLITTLRKLGEVSEPFAPVKAREAAWIQATFGWTGRLTWYVNDLAGGIESIDVACPEAEQRCRALHRILLLELAIENYHDEHSQYPEQLEALVPNQLNQLPLDPFSNKPLKYQRTDAGYLLYSVGPDGLDNNGSVYGGKNGHDITFE